jgi:hypothetical protein
MQLRGSNGLDWMLLRGVPSTWLLSVRGGMVVLEPQRAGGICPQPSDLTGTPHLQLGAIDPSSANQCALCRSLCLDRLTGHTAQPALVRGPQRPRTGEATTSSGHKRTCPQYPYLLYQVFLFKVELSSTRYSGSCIVIRGSWPPVVIDTWCRLLATTLPFNARPSKANHPLLQPLCGAIPAPLHNVDISK